jgi:hypothetical protein
VRDVSNATSKFKEKINNFTPPHLLNFSTHKERIVAHEQKRRKLMHSVIRTYSGKGSKEFFDILEKRKSEVADLMRSVKGFVSYTLFRSGEGGCSVTVCQDKMGVDESGKMAKEWTAKNAGDTRMSAPTVSEGSVIVHA